MSSEQASYSFKSFVQAANDNHARPVQIDRLEHEEEKTAVPDWVVVRAGSC